MLAAALIVVETVGTAAAQIGVDIAAVKIVVVAAARHIGGHNLAAASGLAGQSPEY